MCSLSIAVLSGFHTTGCDARDFCLVAIDAPSCYLGDILDAPGLEVKLFDTFRMKVPRATGL
jgi:hypothetical protein